MGSLYRRKLKGKHLPRWYGKYRDENDRIRCVALATDKGVANRMLAQLERTADEIRHGIASPYKVHAVKPITDHLQEYLAGLTDNSSRHVRDTEYKIRKILSGCRITRIGELNESAINRWLAKREFSPSTRNGYQTAIKGFARWLWESHRTPEHKLAGLKKINPDIDRRHQRRSLTELEFQKLLATTKASKRTDMGRNWWFTGEARHALYLTAAYTGLRASELASLTVASFDLASSPPTVTVEASNAKNGKAAILPIPQHLAEHLQGWFAKKKYKPSSKLFPGSWAAKKMGGKFIQRDLNEANIPYRNEANRVFDFHALRGQYATALSRAGVHPRKAQQLMRHSDINLTMKFYTDLHVADLAGDVAKLEPPQQDQRSVG